MKCCYEDANYGVGMYAPCLKPKGHKGKHEHFILCRNPSCICGGLREILEEEGFLTEWKGTRAKINELFDKLWKIEDKVRK